MKVHVVWLVCNKFAVIILTWDISPGLLLKTEKVSSILFYRKIELVAKENNYALNTDFSDKSSENLQKKNNKCI